MSCVERYDIELASGTVIHQLSTEGRLFGFVAIEPDGRVRIWRETWMDEYAPTKHVFPGFVSAARALLAGAV